MSLQVGPNYRLVLVSAPAAVAEPLAATLLDERLAACVNIIPAVVSLYRWQGAVQRDAEALLVIKTSADILPRLAERVRELHPYDVPEVLALPVTEGSDDYLRWLGESLLRGPVDAGS